MDSKTKFFALIFGTASLLVLSYFTAISKTLDIKNNHSSLKKEAFLYKDISKQLQVFSKKEVYYDSILSSLNLTDTSLENNLLKTINLEAQKQHLKLKKFNTPHVFIKDESRYISYDFTIEGSYTSILKLLNKVEKSSTFGEIIHADFNKKNNFRTRKKFLTAKVLIQSIQ